MVGSYAPKTELQSYQTPLEEAPSGKFSFFYDYLYLQITVSERMLLSYNLKTSINIPMLSSKTYRILAFHMCLNSLLTMKMRKI